MKRFQESVAGRTLTIAVALPLAAGASTTWNTAGSGMIWIIASVFAAIVLGLVGIGLAIGEFDREAVAAVLFLPPALLLYTPLLGVAANVLVVRFVMGLGAVTLFAMAWHAMPSPLRFASPRHVTTHST
jgi:hypothetical protein